MSNKHEVVYNYVEDVDQNLVCSICQSALVNPVTTTSCKHTYCRDCITRALAHSPTCPIDRSALTLSSLVDTEPLVQLMLDELKVRCEAPGCSKVMERGLLLAHLRTCSQAVVGCDDAKCGLSMARHRLPHHRAYECFHRRMSCDGCGVTVTFREAKDSHGCTMTPGTLTPSDTGESCGDCCPSCGVELTPTKAHIHRWVCAKAMVPCTQSTRGCPATVPRDELEAHLKVCAFEALGAFFVTNDARLAALEKRQDELRAENEGLRAQIWTMRRFEIVPRSLRDSLSGSRSDDTPPLSSITQEPPATTAQDRSANFSLPTTTRSDPPPTAITRSSTTTTAPATPAMSQPTPTHTVDSLSFPNLEQVIHIPQSFLSPPPRMSYQDWVISRLPPSSAYADGCAALRTALVHLAAGLDAAERRDEVRIMTETLRVHEEVATLRAIVSPMRMQVLSERPNSPAMARFPSTTSHVSSPTRMSTSTLDLPTPPLSTSNSGHGSEPPSDTEDEEGGRASIRESVVFSAQDVYPRSGRASFVSTASATPPPTRWTGRPIAFPPPSGPISDEQPRSPRRLRIGSVGSPSGFISSSLGSSLGATILRRRESSRH